MYHQHLPEIASMSLPASSAYCMSAAPSRLYIALPLLIMGALYVLSSLPGTPLPDDPALYAVFYWVPPSLQNTLHIPAYAALAWAWFWALGAWLQVPLARVIGACAVTSTYGMLDEWHQSFVPGRYATLTDVTLDVAGAVLGVWLAARIGSREGTIKSQIKTDKFNPKI